MTPAERQAELLGHTHADVDRTLDIADQAFAALKQRRDS